MTDEANARFYEERPRSRREEELIVPLVDTQAAGRVYDPSILRWALLGAFIGAVLLGLLCYAIAAGALPIAGFGQFAASGVGVGTFVGTGLGVAIGGLIGALFALYRLPARTPAQRT